MFFRGGENFCGGNHSSGCCLVPTIRWEHGLVIILILCLADTYGIFACDSSTSGRSAPESSLFSATINAGAFLCEFLCSKSPISEEPCHTDLDLPSSSALLHLPPCSYHGEARVPLHAEQGWPGLRRGGSHGRVRGRKLQREYCTSWCSPGRLNRELIIIDSKTQQLPYTQAPVKASKYLYRDLWKIRGCKLTAAAVQTSYCWKQFVVIPALTSARVSQPGDLPVLHHLGAAVSFLCICFYTTILTALTRLCTLSGYERILLPLRVASTVLQIIVTICCILHRGLILLGFYNHKHTQRFMKCHFSPSLGIVRHHFVCAGWVLSRAPVSCVWVDAQRQPAAVRAQLRCGVLLLLLLHAGEHLWQTGGRKAADAHHVLRKAALGPRCLNTRDRQRALRTCSGHFSGKGFICLRCLNYFDMIDQKPFRRYFNEGPDTRPVNQLLFQGVFQSSLLFWDSMTPDDPVWLDHKERTVTASAVQHTLCTDCSGPCVCARVCGGVPSCLMGHLQ